MGAALIIMSKPLSSGISKSSSDGLLEPTATNTNCDADSNRAVPRFWGEYKQHAHGSRQNLINGILCVVALTPSFIATAIMYTTCDTDTDTWDNTRDAICTLALRYPIPMANILFFINVSVGFWIVGMIQRSFWLIDPYWTILPPVLAVFYALNPRAETNTARSAVSMTLIWLWAFRLTWSYFRREEWKFGQQEDWRYTKMARENERWWCLLSFLTVGVAQQPMLVGITLPAYSIYQTDQAWRFGDTIAVVVAVSGLLLAYTADTQLYNYVAENRSRTGRGLHPVPVLATGVWRWSRHPNYLGETLWWLGYGFFAVSVGQWYMLCGWVFNTAVLIQVTFMTEGRMSGNRTGDKLAVWKAYQQCTSCWIPFWCGSKTTLDEHIASFVASGAIDTSCQSGNSV